MPDLDDVLDPILGWRYTALVAGLTTVGIVATAVAAVVGVFLAVLEIVLVIAVAVTSLGLAAFFATWTYKRRKLGGQPVPTPPGPDVPPTISAPPSDPPTAEIPVREIAANLPVVPSVPAGQRPKRASGRRR